MNSVITIWQFALQSIKKYCSVSVLYVLESKGSSSGKQGFDKQFIKRIHTPIE